VIVIAAIITAQALSKKYFADLLAIDFAAEDAVFKISTVIFWIICIVLAVLAFVKNLALIPLMGLSTCLYLLTGMSGSNWKWFLIWFGIGLVVYLAYGYRKSKLATVNG
jgi:hypothetical protein